MPPFVKKEGVGGPAAKQDVPRVEHFQIKAVQHRCAQDSDVEGLAGFDDLTNPNRVLSGQYPTGVADWGANQWYLSRPWRAFLIVCICLAISALYEMIEWLSAVAMGGSATDFLGTQGDEWDTQEDMAAALLGALLALPFARLHDRSMAQRKAS